MKKLLIVVLLSGFQLNYASEEEQQALFYEENTANIIKSFSICIAGVILSGIGQDQLDDNPDSYISGYIFVIGSLTSVYGSMFLVDVLHERTRMNVNIQIEEQARERFFNSRQSNYQAINTSQLNENILISEEV